jgi:hypothetical protein
MDTFLSKLGKSSNKDTSSHQARYLLKQELTNSLQDSQWSPAKGSNLSKESPDGFVFTLRRIFSRSYLHVLLIFVPFGFAAHVAALNNPTVIFGLNALAIIPLTELLIYATENISLGMGTGIGALLNITFGNLVELVLL